VAGDGDLSEQVYITQWRYDYRSEDGCIQINNRFLQSTASPIHLTLRQNRALLNAIFTKHVYWSAKLATVREGHGYCT